MEVKKNMKTVHFRISDKLYNSLLNYCKERNLSFDFTLESFLYAGFLNEPSIYEGQTR